MKGIRLSGSFLAGIPLAFLEVQSAHAYVDMTHNVSDLYRGEISWGEIIGNVVGTMASSIAYVGAAAFLIGALMYVTGFVSEENKSKGKNVMIGSLVGIAIGLSAMAILNSVLYYLYGGG